MIANAYFFPGISFRRALADAAARGVRVVLLLQGRVEYVLLHYASRALYRYFLEAGVEIYEYHRSFLHAKVAVIDGAVGHGRIVEYRSDEPVARARGQRHDRRRRLCGASCVTSLRDAMELGAQRVERDSWKRQRLPLRIMTWICYGLVRFLTGWSVLWARAGIQVKREA